LADTARIERAWLDAYHAADLAPLPAEQLAAVPADMLAGAVFVPHPASRVVRSDFPVMSIFVANRGDGPVVPVESSTSEDTLITRPDYDVAVRLLPSGGAEFLTQLMSGIPLGEAAAAALEASPGFNLAGNIAGMIEAGVFAALRIGDD
jgi:hypothetical protein